MMIRRWRRWPWPLFGAIAAVSLAACGSAAKSAAPSNTSTSKVSVKSTQAPSVAKRKKEVVPHVAFFGFATDNSFAQATWKGVQEEVAAYHGTATFLNGKFSATTQVHQLQDAITSGKYNVFVVQANNGAAVVPEVKEAIAKGIVVVAEFTQIGSNYAKIGPQVKGVISVVESAVLNGTDLAKMAIGACGSLARCNVVYYQGDPSLPLDVARTRAVIKELKTDPRVRLLEDPVGGYLASTGETVTEDVLAAHPNVNVLVGSSQAIEGATIVLKRRHLIGKIKLVGNGGSVQAVNYVREGVWYGTYGIPEVTDGATATKYGIEKLEGGHPPVRTNSASLGPNDGVWTRSVVIANHLKGQYLD